jgi:hypothetical protein
MTGKELIMYILQNDLENEIIVKDGIFIGFMNEEEAAIKFGVGVATIKAWYACKMLTGTNIGNRVYFLRNVPDPRRGVMHG